MSKKQLRQTMLDMLYGANHGYPFDYEDGAPLHAEMGFDNWCGWVQAVLQRFVPDGHYRWLPRNLVPFGAFESAVDAVWDAMPDEEPPQ